ncbi:T9SS type A sorting domain-containing protein [candidate division KSB1 bacterium]|nr:T9SS type A sorting domain-containing protein [candidate division KSB1 bacterium]
MKYRTILFALGLLFLTANTSFTQDHQTWSYNKAIYEVNVRQYTKAGTFAAFEDHLERLQKMGVGILWFMPIHPIGELNRLGSLGSYYSVKDYLAVNTEFGTMDEFKALVQKIHDMGMYVIIDWVANHTAWDNPLTITHPDWYSTDEYGEFIPPPGTDWTDVIELDYSQQGLRDYMIEAMKFWVRETDIDGFRCDAVSMVPLDFWETAFTELKNLKPGLFMLAEDDGRQYQYAGFDMTCAWGYFGFGDGLLKRIACGSDNANDLYNYITNDQNRYPGAHYRMYFTSNHDENSWYGTDFEQFGDAAQVFTALTCLLKGMPLVYSGQEAGIDKRLLFFDKDEIEWRQHPFAEIYTTLFNLKKENKALWNGLNGGKVRRVKTSLNEDIFAFIREKDSDKIFAALNLSPEYTDVSLLETLYYGFYTDVFTGDTVTFGSGAHIPLPAWGYKVYRKTEKTTGITINNSSPEEFNLYQNYPNPFNLNTKIRFYLPEGKKVNLTIYNSIGEKVKTLLSEYVPSGFYTISWDSTDEGGDPVSSGLYFYKIITENGVFIRKMILLR